MQKVNKKRPSRCFAMIQKNMRLGNVQVSIIKAPPVSCGPSLKNRIILRTISGAIVATVQMIVFFFEYLDSYREMKSIKTCMNDQSIDISLSIVIGFPPQTKNPATQSELQRRLFSIDSICIVL